MGLLDLFTGGDQPAPQPAGLLGPDLARVTNSYPIPTMEQYARDHWASQNLGGFRKGLLSGIIGMADNDAPYQYAQFLQGLQGLQGANTKNQMGDMTLRGFQELQNLPGAGVTGPSMIAPTMQPPQPAAPPPGMASQIPGPSFFPAGEPPAMPSSPAPASAPAPAPASSSAPPSPVGAPSPAAQPLFSLPELYRRYQIASRTPGMEKDAQQLLSLIQARVPQGAQINADGSLAPMTGLYPFLQGQKYAEASGAAPFNIAQSLVQQAGRAVPVNADQTVRTGMDAMPAQFASLVQNIMSGKAPPLPSLAGAAPGGVPAPAAPAPNMGQRVAGPQDAPDTFAPGRNGVDSTGFPTRTTQAPGGGIQAPYSPEGMTLQKEVLPKQYEAAANNYSAANAMQGQLDMMDHNIELLNQSGWSSTGAGANVKMGALKALNGLSRTLGGSDVFDPQKIATWEDFNKESTRMGFELAKTLGSREAMMIVQQAVAAVPNAENTYLGARLVSSSLRQASQRQTDYYEFLQKFAMEHGGNTMGADVAFNKQNPPGNYTKTAIVNAIPDGAKQLLLSDPQKYRADFDAKYGPSVSKYLLGGK